MFEEVLTLLKPSSSQPADPDSKVELLALRGAALARLHNFPEAQDALDLASRTCQVSPTKACGDALLASGVLAVQQGHTTQAQQTFQQSLEFARAHHDDLQSATALLNLGATSLAEEHFDEAIDWTDSAYRAATMFNFGNTARTALGNLGWAYYKLGDLEKSLELSLEAEKRAKQAGNLVLDLYWTTNIGYVYTGLGDLARAEDAYAQALVLADRINSKEGIYNACRALALLSIRTGNLNEATRYADQAASMAQADKNRLNELYPLLVRGMVAAQKHDGPEAERIFGEVEGDPNVNASLKWRAQHGLAELFENQKRPDAADREYQAALKTFEAARLSLYRDDAKLPFSNNASNIYDDYVHFLIDDHRPNDALRWAEYSRARTLAEGLGLLSKGASVNPPLLDPRAIARRIDGSILYYWLGRQTSYVWVIEPRNIRLLALPPRAEIEMAVQRYRKALVGPQDVLATGNADGQWLYTTLLASAVQGLAEGARIVIVPDGALNNLNFDTLLVPQPAPHYWLEDVDVVNASSLQVLAATSSRARRQSNNLLLIGNSVAPNERFPELPQAQLQMNNVAAHFDPTSRHVLAREQATPATYLSSNPGQFSYIHFVAHGTASRLSPLDSAIILSKSSAESDSFKLYARDIIRQPLHANVVTISSCYGAGERTYAGEGLVGLSWAFLRAGAHNVVAALWEATDASTEKLMEKFYDELKQGASPDVALHSAKLFLLKNTAFHNPFYWAPFQLYAGS